MIGCVGKGDGVIATGINVDVEEKFENYHFGRAGGEIGEHLVWRRTHPEEPPLIVLIATPRP